MDELTLARLEFEQREFTLAKQQFSIEQLKQQLENSQQKFEFNQQQFHSEQQQLKQQFYSEQHQLKQQFELEKITFQHELQQQRDLLSKQQLAIDQQQFELSKQQLAIDQQKKQLAIDQKQHLQSYLIPSSNNCDLGLLSEPVQNEEQLQQLLSQHLIPSPSPSLVTNLLEGMINKSNNHLNNEIEHYCQLTKQLHGVVNHLKKKEKKIEQRDVKSQACLRRNYHIRYHLVCYLKFIKSRHDMIISTMKCNTKLKEDNKSLQKTIDKANHDKDKLELDTTPLYEKQMIVNKYAWEVKSKENKVEHLQAMKEYNEKKVGKEPELGKVQTNVMIKLINLNKNIHLSHSNSNCPLLASVYKIPKSTTLPIFDHFLQKDYDNGTIPKLTNDLKLFFSTQHIDNGRWIQFHGPDKEVDGSTWDNPITFFSLSNPNNVGTFESASDDDRCELYKDECTKQHKETDYNYGPYHSPPLKNYTSRHRISIKWE